MIVFYGFPDSRDESSADELAAFDARLSGDQTCWLNPGSARIWAAGSEIVLAPAKFSGQLIYDNVLKQVQGLPPVSNTRHSIEISEPHYADPETYDIPAQKQAILENRTLSRRLRGTVTLKDALGGVLDSRKLTLANVPFLTDRGTMINKGTEYTIRHQLRLRPGVFTRMKQNGELEAHCLHRTVKVWTEHGMLPIGEIVSKRLAIRVWSYDFSAGQFVLQPVTGWFENRVTSRMGRAVFSVPGRLPTYFDRHHPTVLWATPEHKVFDGEGGKHEIGGTSTLTVVEEQPSQTQLQLIYGSLLGDGHITRGGLYQEGHGLSQLAYLQFKGEILSPFLNQGVGQKRGSGYSRERDVAWLSTKACAFLYRARKECYPNGVKRISTAWLRRLDARGLAFWFGDDGSSMRVSNGEQQTNCLRISLATDGFPEEDIQQLLAWLALRWRISATSSRNEQVYAGRDLGWQIIITGQDAERFLDLVAEYLHPSLHYKLPDRPITCRCVDCGKEIDRRRKTCNACCLQRHRSDRETSTARRRFGNTAVVEQLLMDDEVPGESDPGNQWDARMVKVGEAVVEMLADNEPTLGLATIPCEYRTGDGLHYERQGRLRYRSGRNT